MEVSSARNPQQNDEAETTSGDGVNESYGPAITVQRNLAYMEDTGVCINTYLPHIQIVEFFFFFFCRMIAMKKCQISTTTSLGHVK